MANPLLPPGVTITESDLLLVIGDQTVIIAALRQHIENITQEANSRLQALDNAPKNKAKELDDVRTQQQASTEAAKVLSINEDLTCYCAEHPYPQNLLDPDP